MGVAWGGTLELYLHAVKKKRKKIFLLNSDLTLIFNKFNNKID